MHREGKGDWEVINWPPEDLKAHIRFMTQLHKELSDAGELVAAEGLAAPTQARIVRARKDGDTRGDRRAIPGSRRSFSPDTGSWTATAPNERMQIAARASTAPGPGGVPLNMPIEVREVMSAPPVEG